VIPEEAKHPKPPSISRKSIAKLKNVQSGEVNLRNEEGTHRLLRTCDEGWIASAAMMRKGIVKRKRKMTRISYS